MQIEEMPPALNLVFMSVTVNLCLIAVDLEGQSIGISSEFSILIVCICGPKVWF